MNKITKELLEKSQPLLFNDRLEEVMSDISLDCSEYLMDHLGEKLIITCRWVALLEVWELSATTIPIGSDPTESKCSETTPFVPQISVSDQKEPFFKPASDKQLFVTQGPSLTKTDTKLTSQQTGKHINWDEEAKKEDAINKQIVSDKGEWLDGSTYKSADGWITDYDTGAMWFVPDESKNEVDLSKLHGDELVEAIRDHWKEDHNA